MRESCISHVPGQRIAIVREDYFELTGNAIAAAILNLFEYWANGTIAVSGKEAGDWVDVGRRAISEFESGLLGIAAERHIRTNLQKLEDMGYISTDFTVGHPKAYLVNIKKIQQDINNLDPGNFAGGVGKTTEVRSVILPGGVGNFAGVGELEPAQGASFSAPKNREEEFKEFKEDPPIPPNPVSGSVSNFETSFKMRSQVPKWKVDHTTFREELIKAVWKSFPTLYTLDDGKMNRVKILTYLKNLENKGDLNQFEILWSAVSDSVLEQSSGADNSVQQEKWLQLMREQGQAFYRDRDGSINAVRFQFFQERSKEVWG